MDLDKIKKELNTKYENIDIKKITPGEKEGSYVLELRPHLAYLDRASAVMTPSHSYAGGVPDEFKNKMHASNFLYRDALTRNYLDLVRKDFTFDKPHKLYEIIHNYYWTRDVFGAYIDVLIYFASSGFRNECRNSEIKNFYDHWCYDLKIRKTLDQIFAEYFKTGFVRTYRVLGTYTPEVSPLEPIKFKLKGAIPIAYHVLNPLAIEIDGPLWLNQTRVTMSVDKDMKDFLEKPEWKLTPEEQRLIKALPSEMKKDIKDGKKIVFDPNLIGAVDYMKMDWERYPIPLGARCFDALDYKMSLREADYSAVDGVTHEILKVTIGNDEFPAKLEDLERLADTFNTPAKSFAVFFNHTLQIERITMENVDQIFGPAKFEQVNRDISGALGVVRAFVDGVVEGTANSDSLKLGVKSLLAKLNYARRDVADWLETEYKHIAKIYKLPMFPYVKFDEMELKEELQIKTLLHQLADRRIVSYRSIQEGLGFDPDYERAVMAEEVPLIEDGTLGMYGSPYQQSAGGSTQVIESDPSQGRPKNKIKTTPPKPATPEGEIDYKTKIAPKREIKKAASLEEVSDIIMNLDEPGLEVLQQVINKLKNIKTKEDKIN